MSSLENENSFIDVRLEALCHTLEQTLDAFSGEPEMLIDIIKEMRTVRSQFMRIIERHGNTYENKGQKAVDLIDRAMEVCIPSVIQVPESERQGCKDYLLFASDDIHELQRLLIATKKS